MRNYTRRMRAALLVVLAAALLFSVGCGSSNSSKNSGLASNTYLYVEAAGAIAQLRVQSDGTLTPLSPATVGSPAFENWTFAAVDPSGQYLIASNNNNQLAFTLNQYVIGSAGTLTPNQIPAVGTDMSAKFIFTPDGKFAIVPDFTGGNSAGCCNGTLNAYSLSSFGTLSLVSQGAIPSLACGPQDPVAVDPSGQFVYLLCNSQGFTTIYEYSLSANGTLTPLSPSSVVAGSGANNFAVAPNGFLYSVNSPGTIIAFWVDESTGQLANAGSFQSGTGGQGGPVSIAFDPTGTFAYAANSNDNSVTQFTVDRNTGALTMNGSDVPTGRSPCRVAVDPSGKFVFVTNWVDGTISQFVADNSGRLTPNGTFSLGPNANPTEIAFAQR